MKIDTIPNIDQIKDSNKVYIQSVNKEKINKGSVKRYLRTFGKLPRKKKKNTYGTRSSRRKFKKDTLRRISLSEISSRKFDRYINQYRLQSYRGFPMFLKYIQGTNEHYAEMLNVLNNIRFKTTIKTK